MVRTALSWVLVITGAAWMFGVALTIIVWAISTSDGIVEAVFVLLDFSNPEHTGRSHPATSPIGP